jgi:hypothetical protein
MPPGDTGVPRASAVIPVRDGALHLETLLPALREQGLPGGLEIVAVCSFASSAGAPCPIARICCGRAWER